jgi:hypothetical protein
MSNKAKPDAPKHDQVEVIVDGVAHRVMPGSYVVADFKKLVGVDPTKELEQVVEGKLVPLADDATIVIAKGGSNRFVSHIRRGGSS